METTSPALLRALRQIEAHPRVLTITNNLVDDLTIVALIDVGFNNRWKALGTSPGGVRPVEPVTISFTPRYPMDCPNVMLRSDFDRSHPHLLPGRSTEAPRPCYIDGSPRDLLRLRGIYGLIDQIVDWLEKAAAMELIDLKQGWEPVRRDWLDDFVEADAHALRALVDAKGGAAFFAAPFTAVGDVASHVYCCHVLQRIALGPNVATLLREKYGQVGIAIAFWAGRDPSGGERIAATYQPETVSNVRELYEHARALGLAEVLTSHLSLLQTRFKQIPIGTRVVISIILLIRRPIALIGQDSRIEILPYVIEVNRASDLEPASLKPVRLAAHRSVINSRLLAELSGSTFTEPPQWTLLGAGSVGSKLALHLAREGKAPSIVLDSATLRPHNFSRHGLLPPSILAAYRDEKAFSLSEAIQSLGQPCVGYRTDIIWLATAAADEDREKAWPKGTRLIVDATGSPTVTDVLCCKEIANRRPRAAETSLFGRGRVAYLAVEGIGANPNLQDIAAESFRLFSADRDLASLVFEGQGDLASVGQGCSTLTARMSDATLSAPVPALSASIARLLQDDKIGTAGEILLGVINEDLLGQVWTSHKIEPYVILSGDNELVPSVRLSKRVLNLLESTIASKDGVETGGVLIGRFNEGTNSFHVVDVIPAPDDSTFSPSLFTLGTAGLRDRLSKYLADSHGTLYPLGTWHNHLEDSPASQLDHATGVQLAFGQLFPALMIIKTPDRVRGLVLETQVVDETSEAIVKMSAVEEEGRQSHDVDIQAF